jgi:S-methylmethionine-dependent homocysteine/selenocysteine methylase
MSKYRKGLPQLSGRLFLMDGGLETTLIFHEGVDLPYFAAFYLLRDRDGRAALTRYYERYIAIAKAQGGYSRDDIAAANRDAVRLMLDLRDIHESAGTPTVVSGCVGPRGDGYDPSQVMTAQEAETYHSHQIGAFAEAGADMITAMTMTNTNER